MTPKKPLPTLDRTAKTTSRAKKLYAAFAISMKLKRTWERISESEQDAWLAVAAVG